jgi:hypothetical protein
MAVSTALSPSLRRRSLAWSASLPWSQSAIPACSAASSSCWTTLAECVGGSWLHAVWIAVSVLRRTSGGAFSGMCESAHSDTMSRASIRWRAASASAWRRRSSASASRSCCASCSARCRRQSRSFSISRSAFSSSAWFCLIWTRCPDITTSSALATGSAEGGASKKPEAERRGAFDSRSPFDMGRGSSGRPSRLRRATSDVEILNWPPPVTSHAIRPAAHKARIMACETPNSRAHWPVL